MLIGGKVCLGPMLKADAPIIFNWRNRVDVLHQDGLYRPLSQGNFDDWFNGIGRDPSRVVFSIRRQGDLNFLGYIQVVNINAAYRTADLGIMIGEKDNRGKGYGQEALRLCVEFCWKELNLQRLGLIVVGENPAAVRTYEKVGFEREGVMRRSCYVNGEFRDTTFMSVLRPL
jgi:RimJ/RimL family protein N-acetyltransferase